MFLWDLRFRNDYSFDSEHYFYRDSARVGAK